VNEELLKFINGNPINTDKHQRKIESIGVDKIAFVLKGLTTTRKVSVIELQVKE